MDNLIWDKKFQAILSEAFKLHKKLRVDHTHGGNVMASFLRAQNVGIEPWKGILIRLSDKFNLLENYVRKGKYKNHDESLRETLLDICSYSVAAIILLENYPKSQLNKRNIRRSQ